MPTIVERIEALEQENKELRLKLEALISAETEIEPELLTNLEKRVEILEDVFKKSNIFYMNNTDSTRLLEIEKTDAWEKITGRTL